MSRPISNGDIADTCERMVCQPYVPQDAAWVLAIAARRLRDLSDRCARLSHRAEQLEGDNKLLFHLHYGPQRGGAA